MALKRHWVNEQEDVRPILWEWFEHLHKSSSHWLCLFMIGSNKCLLSVVILWKNNRKNSVDTPWTPFTASSKLPSTVRSAWKVEEFIIIKKLLQPWRIPVQYIYFSPNTCKRKIKFPIAHWAWIHFQRLTHVLVINQFNWSLSVLVLCFVTVYIYYIYIYIIVVVKSRNRSQTF